MIDIINLGLVLRELRKYRGLKTYQLARIVDKSTDSIKKYESGYTTIPISMLDQICIALECKLEITIKCDDKEYVIK